PVTVALTRVALREYFSGRKTGLPLRFLLKLILSMSLGIAIMTAIILLGLWRRPVAIITAVAAERGTDNSSIRRNRGDGDDDDMCLRSEESRASPSDPSDSSDGDEQISLLQRRRITETMPSSDGAGPSHTCKM